MPLPILPIITGLISAFKSSPAGKMKTKIYDQTVGEFVTSKTNLGGSGLMGYGFYLLITDPANKIGHAYLIGGFLVTTIKDAIVKIKKND